MSESVALFQAIQAGDAATVTDLIEARAELLSASILQARQSERVVPPDHQSCGAHAEFGDSHHFIFATSFCTECEELGASH